MDDIAKQMGAMDMQQMQMQTLITVIDGVKNEINFNTHFQSLRIIQELYKLHGKELPDNYKKESMQINKVIEQKRMQQMMQQQGQKQMQQLQLEIMKLKEENKSLKEGKLIEVNQR